MGHVFDRESNKSLTSEHPFTYNAAMLITTEKKELRALILEVERHCRKKERNARLRIWLRGLIISINSLL